MLSGHAVVYRRGVQPIRGPGRSCPQRFPKFSMIFSTILCGKNCGKLAGAACGKRCGQLRKPLLSAGLRLWIWFVAIREHRKSQPRESFPFIPPKYKTIYCVDESYNRQKFQYKFNHDVNYYLFHSFSPSFVENYI